MLVFFIAGLALLSSSFSSSNIATTVEYDSNAIIINGERKIIFSGAIHYPRSTPEMWPDLINKAKEGGLDAIESYVFWDLHEPRPRQYDFSGNLDFIKFFQLIQEAGLYAILRIGPYICAEWNYGGFPVWLHNKPGIELRTNNEIYKNEMEIFTTKIVDMCKEAELFAPQGGPIIIAQIENEYGNVMKGYGEAGKEYVKWCAEMAVAQDIGVPWIMCQQNDAPHPIINTCNGFYCHHFTPHNPKGPKMFTENWTGWFKRWGGRDPYRTAQDLAYSVALLFQTGGVLNNYYMYHGGTNFGRSSGGPFYVTSYDYDAPLDEYGNLNQPKWGHLEQLHAAIKIGEKLLTNSKPKTKEFGAGVHLTMYADDVTGERFCFLSNSNEKVDANVDVHNDGKFSVPAWSVSVLQNCNTEIYNTAKVTTPTEHYSGYSEDSPKLKWTWTPEPMEDTLQGKGTFTAPELLDQKKATSDKSDYLWYMTSVNINEDSLKEATLHVSTRGQVLHAYVNQKLIGSQFYKKADNVHSVEGNDYGFVFERLISLKLGENTIALLSATVGLAVRF
ncbi:beta-galactosidase-like [Tripterygium wilfordii]|uniref:beta-galactosidase-like n=1 Tax=Tripterygium wilfordii TaxID=458696 RepID=UPI0018F83B5F|nr:beta-galactosidase-like [Tripterygium wilfordii]